MSFYRFIYYCAFLGGWCAFVGWLIPELLIPKSTKGTLLHDVLAAGLVGAGIGAGVMGLSGRGINQKIMRGLTGLGGGLLAGAFGGLIGNLLVDKSPFVRWIGEPATRCIGWTIMGLCIGSVEGVYEQSKKKLRNGIIGGCLGGLLGGILFHLIIAAFNDPNGRNLIFTSRAVGFVILGLAIGCLIGLVQVVLREAWLTVIDGYRPGRQVILSQPVTLLGRGEWVALPFMGSFGNALDMEHLRIIRNSDGSFSAEDNDTKNGSEVNRQRIDGRVRLEDGDTIKIGNNIIRFNEKARKDSGKRRRRDEEREESEPVARQATRSGIAPIAPPPPPPTQRGPVAPPPLPSAKPEIKPPITTSAPTVARSETKVPPPPVVRAEGKPPPPPPPPGPKPEVKAPPPPSAKPPEQPKTAPPPKPTAPATSAGASDDLCPGCKRKVPGQKGMRYCMVCDVTF